MPPGILLDEWHLRWRIPRDLPSAERERLARVVHDRRLFRWLERRLRRLVRLRVGLTELHLQLMR